MYTIVKTLLTWLRRYRSRHAGQRQQVSTAEDRQPIATVHAEATGPSRRQSPSAPDHPLRQHDEDLGLIALYDYLDSHYQFRYNLLTDRTEVAESTGDALHYRIINKRILNDIALDAIAHRFDCWDRDVRRWIESGHIAGYHPFHIYFDSLPAWDGVDRVEPLSRRVSSDPLWLMGFHRWLLAMTASWMGNGMKAVNSLAPILISTRQGLGKSTFARQLMPQTLRPYFTEAYDLNQPTTCVRQLSTFGLINLDEFDRIPARRMPQLKTLIQMEELRVRRAYQPQEEALTRLASFIATSNSRALLTDETGSRRFLCIELQQPISREPLDYSQLYAQLKHEVLRGDRWWLSKAEEADLQRHNRAYYVQSPVKDIFHELFEPLDSASTTNAHLLSSQEIYRIIQQHNPAALRGVSLLDLSRQLPQWADRVHTEYGNVYRVRQR